MLLAFFEDVAHAGENVPHLLWVWPFVAILLAIAILPLLRGTHHWWEENRNKLLISIVLALATLSYYQFRGYGVAVHERAATPAAETHHADQAAQPTAATQRAEDQHAGGGASGHDHHTQPGLKTVLAVLDHAVLAEYVPFIILLFSLYVIAGGIVVRGDIRATPAVNTAIIGASGVLASIIGTTGSAMLLVRFLLRTNAERKHKVHTVIFFIFIAANIGGTLLPTGDPPLFLGYLRGVDFFWTLGLWKYWGFTLAILLGIYFLWDSRAYKREAPEGLRRDDTQLQRMQVVGLVNVLWLLGVVGAVATLDPTKAFPGTTWHAPPYLREGVQLAMVVFSLATTPKPYRRENEFNYLAIGEVACLFIGIFITMQIPIEILQIKGPALGLNQPWHFFWATGALSSFLDNAPTYVVYFATAGTLAPPGMALMPGVQTTTGSIPIPLLIAISCGAVFMGANTYIGNGPNFMVKAIAEQSGVKMPSFFGYMAYSCLILLPIFIAVTLIFFR